VFKAHRLLNRSTLGVRVIKKKKTAARGAEEARARCESGPLRAVRLSRHKWPEGLVN